MKSRNTLTSIALDRLHQGDEKGLHDLLERHLRWIEQRVRKRLGPGLRARAETLDYVQDAVAEFLRYGPKVRVSEDAQFRAIMVKIVENTLRGRKDWFTAQRRRISRVMPLPSDTVLSLDPPKTPVDRPSEAVLKNEREAWVRLGLELLDPKDSEIIVLHQWESRTFEDIGGELRITPDAARMRHARAVSRLAKKVSQLRKGDWDDALDGELDVMDREALVHRGETDEPAKGKTYKKKGEESPDG